MSTKPLPPGRPPGSLDLLDPDHNPSPRDRESAEDWRADALGRSRHSRLANEVREPLEDRDPERAERLCAEITRNALGDLAPALLLLSSERRRRLQALTAWTVALFDLALRPGLAGLDGDRLAQINAWEFRTEETLEGNPPGQPVFVAMAQEENRLAWPREALDEVGAIARRMALTSRSAERRALEGEGEGEIELGRALVSVLLAPELSNPRAAEPLAQIIGISIALTGTGASRLLERLDAIRVSEAPRGWRRAARYARRALAERLRRGASEERLGLATRLRFLALSFLR